MLRRGSTTSDVLWPEEGNGLPPVPGKLEKYESIWFVKRTFHYPLIHGPQLGNLKKMKLFNIIDDQNTNTKQHLTYTNTSLLGTRYGGNYTLCKQNSVHCKCKIATCQDG